jgi:hypothetical protein
MQFAISIKVKQHYELPNPILVLASMKQLLGNYLKLEQNPSNY